MGRSEHISKVIFNSVICIIPPGVADYSQVTSSLSFTANDLTDCIMFNVVDDTLTEPTESFTISALQNNILLASATVSIVDNDSKQNMYKSRFLPEYRVWQPHYLASGHV